MSTCCTPHDRLVSSFKAKFCSPEFWAHPDEGVRALPVKSDNLTTLKLCKIRYRSRLSQYYQAASLSKRSGLQSSNFPVDDLSVGPCVGAYVGLSSALWKNGGSDPDAGWRQVRQGMQCTRKPVKSPLVTMARPKFAPKSTPFHGPIPKPHYMPHPWTRPTYDVKRHPDPIRRLSTMHWTDRRTHRPTDRSFTGKFDD